MNSFSDITLGDIGRGLGRYRPAVVTGVAILLNAAFLPGERAKPGGLVATAPPPAVAVAAPSGASAAAPAATAPSAAPAAAMGIAVQPSGTFTTGSSFSSSSGSFTAPPSFSGNSDMAAP